MIEGLKLTMTGQELRDSLRQVSAATFARLHHGVERLLFDAGRAAARHLVDGDRIVRAARSPIAAPAAMPSRGDGGAG